MCYSYVRLCFVKFYALTLQLIQDEAARLARYHAWRALSLTLPAATAAAASTASTAASAAAAAS
jgi:hypothetical protein